MECLPITLLRACGTAANSEVLSYSPTLTGGGCLCFTIHLSPNFGRSRLAALFSSARKSRFDTPFVA